MYDMYRWNAPAGSRDSAAPPAPERRSEAGNGQVHRRPAEAARAVQEALDRRDNGGAAAASREQ